MLIRTMIDVIGGGLRGKSILEGVKIMPGIDPSDTVAVISGFDFKRSSRSKTILAMNEPEVKLLETVWGFMQELNFPDGSYIKIPLSTKNFVRLKEQCNAFSEEKQVLLQK